MSLKWHYTHFNCFRFSGKMRIPWSSLKLDYVAAETIVAMRMLLNSCYKCYIYRLTLIQTDSNSAAFCMWTYPQLNYGPILLTGNCWMECKEWVIASTYPRTKTCWHKPRKPGRLSYNSNNKRSNIFTLSKALCRLNWRIQMARVVK